MALNFGDSASVAPDSHFSPFDLFKQPPINGTVESYRDHVLEPCIPWSPDSRNIFYKLDAQKDWIQLSETRMTFTLQIVKADGTGIDAPSENNASIGGCTNE